MRKRSLHKLEFKLFLLLKEWEIQKKYQQRETILLNLQVSGGQDSMSLLEALSRVIFSPKCKLIHNYVLIAQHFNHQKRGHESEQDMVFVAKKCMSLGIPLYTEFFDRNEFKKTNFQENARIWRKVKAARLCENWKSILDFKEFFIVTAHHARDHVESLLLHMIRGCGVEGLKGLKIFDEKTHYFRPFARTKYEEIKDYVRDQKIDFREDSSNESDHYTRNYIRHHILPHINHLQKNYEIIFQNLSDSISEIIDREVYAKKEFQINEKITSTAIYNFLKNMGVQGNISHQTLENVKYECLLFLNSKQQTKQLQLSGGRHLSLFRRENQVFLT